MAIIKKSITNAEEDVNKRELSCTVGGNVNEYNHYKEPVWRVLKKLGIKLPHDPTIPLLGIYPEKAVTVKDTCIPIVTAALFAIVRVLKQLRCLLTR